MKYTFRYVTLVTLLLLFFHTEQYASMIHEEQSTPDSLMFTSITNNFEEPLYLIFPHLSDSNEITVTPKTTLHLPQFSYIPYRKAYGTLDRTMKLCCDTLPAVKMITPKKQTFIVFIGALLVASDGVIQGIWVLRIKNEKKTTKGFECMVEKVQLVATCITEDFYSICSKMCQKMNHKNVLTPYEEICMTQSYPGTKKTREVSSPFIPPSTPINNLSKSAYF